VDEAKLNVFKGLDSPVLPGARGQRLYLSGITDDQFEEHRRLLRNVTFADVQRVSNQYLGNSREMGFSTTIGPESTACPSHVKSEPLF
jgi:Zn-dependent M16 (insulinase) family peptidase